MAEHKYDLLVLPREAQGPQKRFPWYKERLKWKYFHPKQNQLALGSSRWRFIPSNVDDFRTGLPTKAAPLKLHRREPLSLPLIDMAASQSRVAGRKSFSPPKFRPVEEPAAWTINSRLGPRQQLQMNRFDATKSSLLEHPFGLFPDLEKSLPPEIAGDIIMALDPEVAVKSSNEMTTTGSESLGRQDQEERGSIQEEGDEMQVKIYHWPLKKTSQEIEEEELLLSSQKAVSPAQEQRVNQVTHDLVQWMKDLGGEQKEYIDKATIKRLFASDYEAKPILTAPIHVVDLVHVPEELRIDSRAQTISSMSLPMGHMHPFVPSQNVLDLHEPTGQGTKTRYGAWYLPHRLWKPRPWNEPMLDPKQEANEKANAKRLMNLRLDTALAGTHGAKAFKEFIAKRPGTTMPKFLKTLGPSTTTGRANKQIHQKNNKFTVQ